MPLPRTEMKSLRVGGLRYVRSERRRRHSRRKLGMAAVAAGDRRIDVAPRVGIGEESFEREHVEAMAAAIGLVASEDRSAGETDVADRVERLVTHEFVGEPQALGVDHPILAEDHGVVERGAE